MDFGLGVVSLAFFAERAGGEMSLRAKNVREYKRLS